MTNLAHEESRPTNTSEAASESDGSSTIGPQSTPPDIVLPAPYGLVVQVFKDPEARRRRANPRFASPAPPQQQKQTGRSYRGGQPNDDLRAWLDPAEGRLEQAEGRAS